MDRFSLRLQNCSRIIESNKIDHLIVSSSYNLKYLLNATFDTGERMTVLLLTPGRAPKLFIHQMFFDQVPAGDHLEIIYYSDDVDPIDILSANLNGKRVGIDQNWLCSYLIDLFEKVPGIKFVKSTIVEELRSIKDQQEIDLLRQSAKIADAVMYQVLQLQHLPATEREVARTIKSFFAEHGVNELSFKPIVGFGENSANPHHTISDQVCTINQPILVDMGGLFKDYCSDITRTFYYGRKNPQFEELYQIVKETQVKAIEMVKPGILFSEIDLFVRSSFSKKGYEENFIHRTGHGIGLELHEGVSIHKNNHDVIQPGMAFSIEPGLYFPNQFGIRIEDIVVVTKNGCEVLNKCSKEEVQYLEFAKV